MPDMDEMKEGKKYYTDVPQKTEGFFSKDQILWIGG